MNVWCFGFLPQDDPDQVVFVLVQFYRITPRFQECAKVISEVSHTFAYGDSCDSCTDLKLVLKRKLGHRWVNTLIYSAEIHWLYGEGHTQLPPHPSRWLKPVAGCAY